MVNSSSLSSSSKDDSFCGLGGLPRRWRMLVTFLGRIGFDWRHSVPHILVFGYALLFLRPPSLPVPSQFTVLSKPVQITVVVEVSALLAKHAIRHVSKTSHGLVSQMFVVPKKDGS